MQAASTLPGGTALTQQHSDMEDDILVPSLPGIPLADQSVGALLLDPRVRQGRQMGIMKLNRCFASLMWCMPI